MSTPERLPTAIFVPNEEDFIIYRGTPDEMVSSMAQAMGADSIEEAIQGLIFNLALHWKVFIRLPEDPSLGEKDLAAFFVHALLDTKIARPMAQA